MFKRNLVYGKSFYIYYLLCVCMRAHALHTPEHEWESEDNL